MVLSSNAVAMTSSGLPGGIVNAPGPGDDLVIDFEPEPDGNSNGKRLELRVAQPLSCTSDSGVLTVWYTWFITAANLKKKKGQTPELELRSADNPSGIPIARGVGSNSGAPNTMYRNVSVTRSDGGGMKQDSYTIEVEIEAECSDANGRYLLARYVFDVDGTTIRQEQSDWQERFR